MAEDLKERQFEPKISPETSSGNFNVERDNFLEGSSSEYQAERSLSEKNEKSSIVENAPPVTNHYASRADDINYKKIEGILEEGLGEAYQRMNPVDQHEFRIKGEETAIEIMKIISLPKIKIKKIIALIISWLKIIPGVNRFFLEKEAKIKAEKILSEMGEDKKIA